MYVCSGRARASASTRKGKKKKDGRKRRRNDGKKKRREEETTGRRNDGKKKRKKKQKKQKNIIAIACVVERQIMGTGASDKTIVITANDNYMCRRRTRFISEPSLPPPSSPLPPNQPTNQSAAEARWNAAAASQSQCRRYALQSCGGGGEKGERGSKESPPHRADA